MPSNQFESELSSLLHSINRITNGNDKPNNPLTDPSLNVNTLIRDEKERVNELFNLTEKNNALLRELESKRIDAVMSATKETAAQQATILANQLLLSNENIKLQINNISERLSIVEKNGNERSGSNLNSKNLISYLVAGLTLLIAIVAIFFHH